MASLGPNAEPVRIRHFADMRGALAVHRGREVKTLGDGFMAAFESTGDALACAVTMQRAAAHQGDRPDAFQIRIGLSTGEVACEDGDYFGVPVVEASRLCTEAGARQILATDILRILSGQSSAHRLEPLGPMALKGLPEPVPVCEVVYDIAEETTLRVALADDTALLRQGIAQALEGEGMEIVLEASDADELLEHLPSAQPHVVVIDVRMPPTHTTEGLDAATRIKVDYPDVGVLVLSAEVQTSAAQRLLDSTTEGIGYLLKDRVGDIHELTAAIRTVASGGSAIDDAVIERLAASAA
jgi:CheY-like chemotaxis protein